MKKIITISILAATGLLLAQCAPKTPASMASSAKAPADEVAAIKQKYTQEQMDHGKTISLNSCNKCHSYHEASEFSVAKWEKVLPSMTHKAKLNDDDSKLVSAYLISNAKLN
jgi:hypothetical protein